MSDFDFDEEDDHPRRQQRRQERRPKSVRRDLHRETLSARRVASVVGCIGFGLPAIFLAVAYFLSPLSREESTTKPKPTNTPAASIEAELQKTGPIILAGILGGLSLVNFIWFMERSQALKRYDAGEEE